MLLKLDNAYNKMVVKKNTKQNIIAALLKNNVFMKVIMKHMFVVIYRYRLGEGTPGFITLKYKTSVTSYNQKKHNKTIIGGRAKQNPAFFVKLYLVVNGLPQG